MSAYTPGPWSVQITEVKTGKASAGRSVAVLSRTGGVVALMKAADGNKEGNAHLIAAAPQLFEAAKMAVDYLELSGSGAGIARLLRSAIAAATPENDPAESASKPTETRR